MGPPSTKPAAAPIVPAVNSTEASLMGTMASSLTTRVGVGCVGTSNDAGSGTDNLGAAILGFGFGMDAATTGSGAAGSGSGSGSATATTTGDSSSSTTTGGAGSNSVTTGADAREVASYTSFASSNDRWNFS
mmetsp:Transcript_16044/g.29000  ORF Transcript_16044/g.29000 Transcript_16044/m.29000 type:complete len:132 (-) Transcript_16044:28-423(-)